MRTTLFALCVIVAAVPRTVSAQRLAELPPAWASSSGPNPTPLGPPLIKTGDYRLEGTVVGGVLLGAAGLALSGVACPGATPTIAGARPSCTGTKLAMGGAGLAIGASLGYLLGWALPKYRVVGTP